MKKYILLAVAVISLAGCHSRGLDHLLGNDSKDAPSATVRYPSPIDISWTDERIYGALTWDQKNLLDKTAPFFDVTRYNASYRPAYQKFLDGNGRNIFAQWFTDEQFRHVLTACVDLGKLDGLTLP